MTPAALAPVPLLTHLHDAALAGVAGLARALCHHARGIFARLQAQAATSAALLFFFPSLLLFVLLLVVVILINGRGTCNGHAQPAVRATAVVPLQALLLAPWHRQLQGRQQPRPW